MKLIPLVSIGVKRDGKTMHPTIGKAFDFSADEISDLDKLSAQTGIEYYRKPVNEAPEVVEAAQPAASKAGKKKAAETDAVKTPESDPASGNTTPEL